MFKKIILFFSIVFFLTSCTSNNQNNKLKISVTNWVGYLPLLYAKEKGWLKPLDIKLLNVVSLSENMYLYEGGNADAFVGTQYEYNLIFQKNPSLVPIMMFDRSYGGDVVMSDTSIETLQSSTETIDAYLEIDSVNYSILQDFINRYKLQNKRINYINKDQVQISLLQSSRLKRSSIIVSYIPYNQKLEKYGFKELVSTKDGLNILVIDGLFTTESTFQKHQKQFLALKKLVDKAIVALQNDSRKFYETVKPYTPDTSYDEFMHSLDDIIWINKQISPQLYERLQEAHFPVKSLI